MSTLKNPAAPEAETTQSESCCSHASCCEPLKPATRSVPKIGRNEPCPCDSGRKFKKCCGRY